MAIEKSYRIYRVGNSWRSTLRPKFKTQARKGNGILTNYLSGVAARVILSALTGKPRPLRLKRPAQSPLQPAAVEESRPIFDFSGGMAMDELDIKIVRHFPGKMVRKDLTAMLKRGANVPTFVLEYLLGMYCATEDEEAIAKGVETIKRILVENYVHPEESEKIKSKIRESGEYTIIDKVSATLDEYGDIYVARFTNLEIEHFVLPTEYAVKYSKILMGGIWCIVRIAYQYVYDEDEKEKKAKRRKRNPEDSPFKILSIKPIQMPNLDIGEMIATRREFSSDEWRDVILRSSGMEPAVLSEKEKMHFLQRLVPLIERNYNYCELGPRGTGKSHIYKEISPYSILMSGGKTSTANLFFNMRLARVGLVGHWDCVAFDEVAGMRFNNMDIVQIMKDYMASGSFARGRDIVNADASMVFVGNINESVETLLKVSHLFDPFPPEFNNDSAFFDRIHYYVPGWEVPKLRSDMLTERYALITDCLAEFCREMRKRDFSGMFDRYFSLNKDFNKRDEIGVRKTFAGLCKLWFPDGEITKEETKVLLEYAIEGRRRVKEQLKIMAGVEFGDVRLGYIDKDTGEETIVPVPEQTDAALIPVKAGQPGHVYAVGRSLLNGEVCMYKLENKTVSGDGKLETQGIGYNRPVKECVNAAFQYFQENAAKVQPGVRVLDKDYLLYYADTQGKGLSDQVSLAEFIGLCSVASNRPVMPSLAIAGEIKLSGTLEEITNLPDIIRVAKNAGAKKILLPMDCIKDLQSVSRELLGRVQPVLYEHPIDAARKAMDIE